LAILLAANAFAGVLPIGMAPGFPFALPEGNGLMLLLILGALTAAAQYLLAFAYRNADATYLQPFSDVKVFLGGVIGWIALGQEPSLWFWPGALMIVAASA